LTRFFNKESRAGAAHLALVEEDSHHRAVDCLLDVGIGEHDVRRLAAKLKRDLRQVVGRGFAINLPTSVEPVKATFVDTGMRGERGAGSFAVTGNDVDDAVGEALLPESTCRAPSRRDGRLLGGFQHDGVAGGERGREFPRGHQQRKVPGNDLAANADRLAQRVVEHLAGNGESSRLRSSWPNRRSIRSFRDLRQVNVGDSLIGLPLSAVSSAASSLACSSISCESL
jgi:hypothetical protein